MSRNAIKEIALSEYSEKKIEAVMPGIVDKAKASWKEY